MNTPSAPPASPPSPGPDDLGNDAAAATPADESVAGEEDPGAALESLVDPKVNPASPPPPSGGR
ncbi:MAG: hypothetical protein KF891_00615 [Rhizobacter sp.]|nr:hypothetical protein [Rhizobacter sp.]